MTVHLGFPPTSNSESWRQTFLSNNNHWDTLISIHSPTNNLTLESGECYGSNSQPLGKKPRIFLMGGPSLRDASGHLLVIS